MDVYLPVIVALIVIIITIVLLILRRISSSRLRYILLTGLNDSGKTLIYSQLIYNRHVTTYTSSQVNLNDYSTDGKHVTLVDLPGFHSVRQQYFEKFKNQSKGIVYVVDSCTLTKNLKDVASALYNILIDPTVIGKRPNLLIVCNKQDQTLAKGCGIIKSMLEKELDTLRNTQLNQPELLEQKTVGAKLGDPSKNFSFASLYCNVEFVEAYAYNKNGTVDLEQLKKWIWKVSG